MPITIVHEENIVYYDVPQLFRGKDSIGSCYLCLLIDEASMEYLCVGVSAKRYAVLCAGREDLRDVFENPENIAWFKAAATDSSFLLKASEIEGVSADMLPEPNTFIAVSPHTDEILKEANELDRTVIHFSISDRFDKNSIELDSLGELCQAYQSVVTYAHYFSIRNLSKEEKKTQKKAHNNKLRAYAATYGSYNIHLYADSEKNVFGASQIEEALSVLDTLTTKHSEERLSDLLHEHQGHLLGSLKKMLKIQVENQLELKYTWQSPIPDKRGGGNLTLGDCHQILDILKRKEELTKVEVFLEGYFKTIKTKQGVWEFYDENKEKTYRGKTRKEKLMNVTSEPKRYKLRCFETLEEIHFSKKEIYSYELVEII